MNISTCPLPTFQRLLRALAEDQNRVAFVRVGEHHAEPNREWLVRDMTFSPSNNQEPVFQITRISNRPSIHSLPDLLPATAVGNLYLGEGPWRGHLWGVIRTDETFEPLHQFSLIGPGMPTIQILNSHISEIYSPASEVFPSWEGQGWVSPSWEGLGVGFFTRWSRTIGALGGEAIWNQLTRLRVAIIGCGRTGSLVAVTLARLGIRQITLIDPDIVEPHNLGEMDAVTDADLGRPKTEAIADHLHFLLSHFPSSFIPIAAPINDPTALKAAKACDVFFCCADNDAARLATAILATLYHKVLVDIGTGIFYRNMVTPSPNPSLRQAQDIAHQGRGTPSPSPNPSHQGRGINSPPLAGEPVLSQSKEAGGGGRTPRTMGADVRLILPGDGCLLCRGNLSNYAQAVEDLCNSHLSTTLQQEDWNQQRAGSLRTLNQLAAALGVQLLQDLVAERLQSSTWAHLEFDEVGYLTVNYPPTPQPTNLPTCALCAKAGLGDEGLRPDAG